MKFMVKWVEEDVVSKWSETTYTETWWDEYDRPEIADPVEFARRLCDYFNSTLKKGENPRRILEVQIIEVESHSWQPSNKDSEMRVDGVYDFYKCSKCGITAFMWGKHGYIVLDERYQNQLEYRYCDSTREYLCKCVRDAADEIFRNTDKQLEIKFL